MLARVLSFLLCICCVGQVACAEEVPRTVAELWSDFDPREDELDVEIVRQWEQDGIVYRFVTYRVGTIKNKPARMAAFYGYPKDLQKLPGLLHLHGGVQRVVFNEAVPDSVPSPCRCYRTSAKIIRTAIPSC